MEKVIHRGDVVKFYAPTHPLADPDGYVRLSYDLVRILLNLLSKLIKKF